jgi:hypothetical protein
MKQGRLDCSALYHLYHSNNILNSQTVLGGIFIYRDPFQDKRDFPFISDGQIKVWFKILRGLDQLIYLAYNRVIIPENLNPLIIRTRSGSR